MSSYQIKRRGNQSAIEVRRRRNNEKKNVARRKKQEKALLNRQREGGLTALSNGKMMLGSVRTWAITADDEYYPDPMPPNAVRTHRTSVLQRPRLVLNC